MKRWWKTSFNPSKYTHCVRLAPNTQYYGINDSVQAWMWTAVAGTAAYGGHVKTQRKHTGDYLKSASINDTMQSSVHSSCNTRGLWANLGVQAHIDLYYLPEGSRRNSWYAVLITRDVVHSPQIMGLVHNTDLWRSSPNNVSAVFNSSWSACWSASVQLENHTQNHKVENILMAWL